MPARSFAVFDHLSEPVLVLKKDGVINYVNPAAEEFFGGSVVNTPSKKLFSCTLTELEIEEGVGSLEYKDNSYSASVSTLSGMRVLIIHRSEEAEAKKLEEGYTKFFLAAGKEMRNALSTSKLAGDSIKKRAAEDGDIALIRYSSSISHAWHSMNRTVDHLTSFLEAEYELTPLNDTVFDLREYCYELVSSVNYLAGDKLVKISVETEESELYFAGYEREIERLILNLLSNSLKFTPEGGKITLSLKRNKNMVILSVADNGVGMPPEKAAKLFRPFETLRALREDKTGVGLGLYLVHRSAQLHGGGVAVESHPGKGTRVTVSLKSLRSASELSSPEARPEKELDAILTELADILPTRVFVYDPEN